VVDVTSARLFSSVWWRTWLSASWNKNTSGVSMASRSPRLAHTRARLLIDRDAEATPWTRRPADTVTSASAAAAAARLEWNRH